MYWIKVELDDLIGVTWHGLTGIFFANISLVEYPSVDDRSFES